MAELERIQGMIPLPVLGELERMISGEMPLSAEAYVLAILQHAVLNLEASTLDVRVCLHIDNFRKAEHRIRRPGREFDLASGLKAVIFGRAS